MTTVTALESRPLKPLFFSYLFPAIVGMLLMSVNILVDGIFVSQGIGPTVLAGINIAVPIFPFYYLFHYGLVLAVQHYIQLHSDEIILKKRNEFLVWRLC